MTPDEMHIRRMTRDELDTLVEWAAREGWNPGLDDAEVFWATDPDGFVAAEIDGELVGGGSIVAYDKCYGFMGFFIMRPECRGHGLGDRLWDERKRRLLARLDAGASIGLDGVFNMQGYYARGGFRFVCRDLRFEGRGMGLGIPRASSKRARFRLIASMPMIDDTFPRRAAGSCEAGSSGREAMLSPWWNAKRYSVMGSCGPAGPATRSALFSLRTRMWRSSCS